MINNNWSRSNVIVYAKGGKNGLPDFFAANKGIFLTKGLIYFCVSQEATARNLNRRCNFQYNQYNREVQVSHTNDKVDIIERVRYFFLIVQTLFRIINQRIIRGILYQDLYFYLFGGTYVFFRSDIVNSSYKSQKLKIGFFEM